MQKSIQFMQLPGDREQQLRSILVHAFNNCPHYRELYSSSGLSEKDLRLFKLEDISQLPETGPQDLRESWRHMSVIDEESFRATSSGGTTGKPKLMVRTYRDWEISVDSHVRLLTLAGLKPGDRLLVAVPFDLWSIGFLTMEACWRIQCMAVPVGVRMGDEATLNAAQDYAVNAVFTTPSRWEHLSSLASTDFAPNGMLMLLAGEKLTKQTRAYLESRWGGPVRNIYGSEESDGLGAECGEGNGGMHLLSDRFLFEIEGRNGSSLNDGSGELLLTSLYHRGTPLVRYRMDDLVRVWSEHCTCASPSSLKVEVFGKTGEVLVFRDATRLFGYQVEEVLRSATGAEPRFQVVASLENDGLEHVKICVQSKDGTQWSKERIIDTLLQEHDDIADSVVVDSLRISVEIGDFETIHTKKDKEKRMIDLRGG